MKDGMFVKSFKPRLTKLDFVIYGLAGFSFLLMVLVLYTNKVDAFPSNSESYDANQVETTTASNTNQPDDISSTTVDAELTLNKMLLIPDSTEDIKLTRASVDELDTSSQAIEPDVVKEANFQAELNEQLEKTILGGFTDRITSIFQNTTPTPEEIDINERIKQMNAESILARNSKEEDSDDLDVSHSLFLQTLESGLLSEEAKPQQPSISEIADTPKEDLLPVRPPLSRIVFEDEFTEENTTAPSEPSEPIQEVTSEVQPSQLYTKESFTEETIEDDSIQTTSSHSIKQPEPSVDNSSIGATTYTIKRGDVLWKIAAKFKVSTFDLVDANDLKNPDLIYPGDVLIIPSVGK